ncbi:MAG: aspartate kinase [bacterium (Candidatus Stahlbacteria) CG23_combo_of_CG06-09_8_20_14_all_34_7]|nr:MAG: aspartate kinase [bacterium (Candidatus Stahlbacteria) CG23_combo_of_CG06-09_8_20_14_all_34_7]
MMALIVKKFGGTSLATPSLIMHLAKRIASDIKNNNKVVVVVSAMGKTTNELVSMAKQITNHPKEREMDMLLTAGERISMSLFSMALNALNIKSYSFTGSQVGIITTGEHTNAKILSVKGERLLSALNEGITPIIAGFQGVSNSKEITTLGRGGSDTTAVALSVFLKADLCEIFTDVDGFFTVDPRTNVNAKLIKNISYDEVLIMAHMGSQVLHPRSVEIAKRHNIKLFIKPSLNEGDGTMITNAENIESVKVRGISSRLNLALVNLKTADNNIVNLMKKLNRSNVSIELFATKSTDLISVVVEQDKVDSLLSCTEDLCTSVNVSNDIAIISFVGTGVSTDVDVLDKILSITEKYSNDVFGFFTDKIVLSIVTKQVYVEKISNEAAKAFSLVS